MKFFLLLTLISITSISHSQVKVDGIYKFHPLITTTKVIDELSVELKTKVRDVYSFYDLDDAKSGRRPVIFKIIQMPEDVGNKKKKARDFDFDITEAPQTNEGNVYFISKLDIGGVKVNNVFLYFLHDTLVKLECDRTNELEDAMTVKFGEPLKTHDEKPVKCTYNFTGATVEEKEYTFTSTWGDTTGISVVSSFWKYYDDKCKENFNSYFIMQEDEMEKRYHRLDLAARKIRNARKEELEKASNAEKYKDF